MSAVHVLCLLSSVVVVVVVTSLPPFRFLCLVVISSSKVLETQCSRTLLRQLCRSSINVGHQSSHLFPLLHFEPKKRKTAVHITNEGKQVKTHLVFSLLDSFFIFHFFVLLNGSFQTYGRTDAHIAWDGEFKFLLTLLYRENGTTLVEPKKRKYRDASRVRK